MTKIEEMVFLCNETNEAERHCRIKIVRLKSQPGIVHWFL